MARHKSFPFYHPSVHCSNTGRCPNHPISGDPLWYRSVLHGRTETGCRRLFHLLDPALRHHHVPDCSFQNHRSRLLHVRRSIQGIKFCGFSSGHIHRLHDSEPKMHLWFVRIYWTTRLRALSRRCLQTSPRQSAAVRRQQHCSSRSSLHRQRFRVLCWVPGAAQAASSLTCDQYIKALSYFGQSCRAYD